MNIPEKAKAAFPYILLLAYGLFSCGYFFLDDYASHYRLYARFVFFLGLFAFPATRPYFSQSYARFLDDIRHMNHRRPDGSAELVLIRSDDR